MDLSAVLTMSDEQIAKLRKNTLVIDILGDELSKRLECHNNSYSDHHFNRIYEIMVFLAIVSRKKLTEVIASCKANI